MTNKVCNSKYLKTDAAGNPAKTFSYLIALAMVFLISASAMPVEAALNAAGPLSTVHGFPTYYQDTTGLALQPCLGVNADGTGLADPNCVLPLAGEELNFNPTLSVSFPNNFPSEHFYYIADAGPIGVGTAGAKAKFRIAAENAFATGDPAVGQQIVFLRINFAVNKVGGTNGLTPNSAYVVNHPFGTFTVNTDALGDIIGGGGADFRAEDGAFTPPLTVITASSFLAAPNTGIGPFLKAVTPAPPAGYIGNPAITQTIQPGPNGAVFSISGPNVDGFGNTLVSTDQWALAGKIAVIDIIPPVITPIPATVTVGTPNAINIPANVNVTDNLFVGSVTMDIGPAGNNFSATINGVNAGTASPATGNGTFTIDTSANTLSFNINIAGLTNGIASETSAHIHGPNQALFTLPLGSPKTGTWNYAEALEADILAGNMRVEIHTPLFPLGEIAGPIVLKSNVQPLAPLLITDPLTKSGTYGVLIPSATRVGTFNLPVAASDGSNTATGNFVLTVAPLLNAVSVTPSAASVGVSGTTALSASALDVDGVTIAPQPPIIWSSSNNSIATVSATGTVTGVSIGTATITASATLDATTKTNTSTITVTPLLNSVSVTPVSANVIVGNTLQLTASPLTAAGAPVVGATVTWDSSNPAIANVSSTGLVTAVAAAAPPEGLPVTITATATHGGFTVTNTSALTIMPIPVLTTVGVAPTTASVIVGGTTQLTASPKDQGARDFVGATIAWTSSNISVATVSPTGVVIGVALGTATITANATNGTVSVLGTSTITVANLTSVGITPLTSSVLVGGTQQLTATPMDATGTAITGTGVTVTWTSSNTSVATVNANGLVSGAALGTTTITATATGAGATITTNATINVVQLASVGVAPATASVTVGGTQQLTATPLDQLGNAFVGATVTWSSSNPAVATVNATTGLVTTITTGTTTITATATSGLINVNGTSAITVNPVPPPPAPPSSGGGSYTPPSSGGGGAPSTTRTVTHTPPAAAKVSKITVNLVTPAASPSITIAEVASVPVAVPQNPVYQYMNIQARNFNDSNINNATVEFEVEKSWIASNNVETVYLARYDNGWNRLPTTLVSTTGNSNTYRATTPGFSYFAIVGEKAAPAPTQPPAQPPLPPPAQPPAQPPAEPAVPTGQFLGIASTAWVWIVAVLIVLAGLAYWKGLLGKKE